eukprot:5185012-Pyramimonas_sp.AAC.1
MGPPDAYILITESGVRTFCHDALYPSHDKDYRTSAAFPPPALRETAVHVVRVDPRGRARLEVIGGAKYDSKVGGRD